MLTRIITKSLYPITKLKKAPVQMKVINPNNAHPTAVDTFEERED